MFRGLGEYERLSCSKRALQLQVESEASSADYSIARCARRDAEVDAGKTFGLLHLSTIPFIAADGAKLKQVVINLCKNAVEAMPQGGTLTLRAYNSGEQVRLGVSDTGVGIPSGVDIFAPFTTTKADGTGLGLAIVRQIVQEHKGTLTYHSVPGQGTTFTLALPIAQSETN